MKTKRLALPRVDTRSMVKIGMLASIGVVLLILNFPLPIFPTFLKMDLSYVPSIVGTYAMGPLAGVLIELFKNILKFIVGTNTGGVGEVANFLVGIAYVIPLGLVLKRFNDRKGALTGNIIGVLSMSVSAGILNYFIFIPAFAWVLGFPIDAFVDMAASVNSRVTDFRSLIIFGVVPFNLFKGAVTAFVGYGLFKTLQPLWRR